MDALGVNNAVVLFRLLEKSRTRKRINIDSECCSASSKVRNSAAAYDAIHANTTPPSSREEVKMQPVLLYKPLSKFYRKEAVFVRNTLIPWGSA